MQSEQATGYPKPKLIVISGPNGAGKSTHGHNLLPVDCQGTVPFDRDKTRSELEKQLLLAGETVEKPTVQADHLMEKLLLKEMESAIHAKSNFALETPLSHPDYWLYIDRFKDNGYDIQLCYVCLDKVEDCQNRVCQRVKEGGHNVDHRTVKGVYEMNLKYINDFKDTFDSIRLYDGMSSPTLLALISGNKVDYASTHTLKKSWVKTGLPLIAEKIALSLKQMEKKEITPPKTKRRGQRIR